ncbi:MAG: hypothetical protein KDA61_02235 [Planctomycetales bacterium]|nr:hypothetical protein [Planctomycetales bacterium]
MNWSSLITPELSGRLCLALLHSLWQVAGLFGLAWIISRLWRKHPIEWEYALHVTALGMSCLCVPFTFWLVAPSTTTATNPAAIVLATSPAPPAAIVTPPLAAPATPSGQLADHQPSPPAASIPLSVTPRVSAAREAAWQRLAPWLTGLYAVGVLLMLGRLAMGIVRAERLRKRGKLIAQGPITEALRRLAEAWSMKATPALATAERIVVPKVVGLLRPTILLPASALIGLTTTELEMILAHELAHVRRYDMWINLTQRLAETALFFNPALWLLSRRISTLREYCCDELACGGKRRTAESHVRYARSLIKVVELAQGATGDASQLATLAASGRTPSELRRRIARLFGEPLREPLQLSRGMAAAGVCLAALLLSWPAVQSWATDSLGAYRTPQASVELSGPFPAQASAIVRDLLQQNRLPFLNAAQVEAISSRFGRELAEQCRLQEIDVESTSETRRSAILTRLRDDGARHLGLGAPKTGNTYNQELNRKYLTFPDRLDTLRWKIMMALRRGDLSDAQAAQQAKRLAFLQGQIARAPETPYTSQRSMNEVIRDWFDDPLQTPIDQRFTVEQNANYERRVVQFLDEQLKDARTANDYGSAFSAAFSRMIRYAADELWNVETPRDSIPQIAGETVGLGVHGTFLHLSFARNALHESSERALGLIEKGSFVLDAATRTPIRDNFPQEAPALLEWAQASGRGDVALCRQGLLGLRGALLARLDAANWPEADRLSDDELLSRIESQGTPMLAIQDEYATYEQTHGLDYPGFYLGILTAEGKLAVAHLADFSGPEEVHLRVRPRDAARSKSQSEVPPQGAW